MNFAECVQNCFGGFTFSVGNVPFGIRVDGSKRSEVLFTEKCIRATDVRIVVLVPDSILACNRDKPFRHWILANFGYRATISFTSGKGGIFWNSSAKTSAMVVDKRRPPGDYHIFMAILEKNDDVKQAAAEWFEFQVKESQSLKRIP